MTELLRCAFCGRDLEIPCLNRLGMIVGDREPHCREKWLELEAQEAAAKANTAKPGIVTS